MFGTGEIFPERTAVFLASQICSGMAAAHDLRDHSGDLLNLVHRDLTPGNVLVGFDGDVKITDFGLAKAKKRMTETAIGVTKGQLAYMSPEQVRGMPLDGRSDIFALGVVFFELLAGWRPWEVKNVGHALERIVGKAHPSLLQARPKLESGDRQHDRSLPRQGTGPASPQRAGSQGGAGRVASTARLPRRQRGHPRALRAAQRGQTDALAAAGDGREQRRGLHPRRADVEALAGDHRREQRQQHPPYRHRGRGPQAGRRHDRAARRGARARCRRPRCAPR